MNLSNFVAAGALHKDFRPNLGEVLADQALAAHLLQG
jgi:hypothetical protein